MSSHKWSTHNGWKCDDDVFHAVDAAAGKRRFWVRRQTISHTPTRSVCAVGFSDAVVSVALKEGEGLYSVEGEDGVERRFRVRLVLNEV